MTTPRPYDRERVVDLLTKLVAIDSVNPSLVPGGSGEADIASFVASHLERLGLTVEMQTAAPSRPNVLGTLRGSGGGKSLILNGHLDTVGFTGMEDPLTLRVEGDRAFGRGAYDMKGGIAAILLAAEVLVEESSGLRGDVIVQAVVDEEYASAGTEAALGKMKADGAIVTEPTGLAVSVAHRGFAWIEIETEGLAAHGSRPDIGRDSIIMMGHVLGRLEELRQDLAARPPHLLLGTASLHASLIQGGQELSSYPARCLLQLERRTLPGEKRDDVMAEVAGVLAQARLIDGAIQAEANMFFWRDPFEADQDSEVVAALRKSADEVLGREAEVIGQPWWMDSALLGAAGIPTAVLGPGGEGAHGIGEWVSLPDIAACAEILAACARRFCG